MSVDSLVKSLGAALDELVNGMGENRVEETCQEVAEQLWAMGIVSRASIQKPCVAKDNHTLNDCSECPLSPKLGECDRVEGDIPF